MNNVFEFAENHTNYEKNRNSGQRIQATKYGIETPSYHGPILWNFVPNEYKAITSLVDFKTKIKT